jgi:hypothetical protein
MKSPPIDIVLEVEGAAKVKKNSKNREWREKRAEAKRRGGERETLGVMPLPATQIQVPTIRNPAQKERSGEKKAVDNRSRRPEGAVPRVVKTAGVIKLMVKMKTFGISEGYLMTWIGQSPCHMQHWLSASSMTLLSVAWIRQTSPVTASELEGRQISLLQAS